MCYLMVIVPLPAIHMHVSAINIIFMYNIFQKIELLRARVEQQKNERDKVCYEVKICFVGICKVHDE